MWCFKVVISWIRLRFPPRPRSPKPEAVQFLPRRQTLGRHTVPAAPGRLQARTPRQGPGKAQARPRKVPCKAQARPRKAPGRGPRQGTQAGSPGRAKAGPRRTPGCQRCLFEDVQSGLLTSQEPQKWTNKNETKQRMSPMFLTLFLTFLDVPKQDHKHNAMKTNECLMI